MAGAPGKRYKSTTPLRRAFLFAVPVLTALTIARHPPDPVLATDLGAQTDLYIWTHVGLLFMLPLLGIAIWMLLDGVSDSVATVARFLLPFAIVFYAAFDALVGIAAGVLSRETLQLSGVERAGAEVLVARWLEIPMPLPVVSTIAVVLWSITLLAAAIAHWRADSPWIVVAGLALAGPLFGFGHPYITGIIGMAGLLVAAVVIELGWAQQRVAPGDRPRAAH
jgi:hypothetical protein